MFRSGDMRKSKGGEHQDAFIIDYRFPVEPQLEVIRTFALNKRMRRIEDGRIKEWPERRVRVVEWPNYLRILDGFSEGAIPAEIGELLFPTDDNSPPIYGRTKRVNNSFKAAQALCDEGYRYIPWMNK